MNTFVTNFCKLHSIHKGDWYQAWMRSLYEHPARSILIDIQLLCYSCPSYSILEKQTGLQLRLRWTNALGTNFWQLLSTQVFDWYQACMCSSQEHPARCILIDILLIYYGYHRYGILEWKTRFYLSLCSTNSVGTNFCILASSQEVDWYQACRRSSFEHPARSILIDIQSIYQLQYTGESKWFVAQAVFNERSWN